MNLKKYFQKTIDQKWVTKQTLQGFGMALIIELISLFLINQFWAREGNFQFFLESTWDLKSIVGFATIAAIPILAVYLYLVQKNKIEMAKGIFYFMVVMVSLLAYVKFFK